MTMRFLSWHEFRIGVHKIGEFAIERKAKAVAGVPRGGLVMAVAVSHEVGMPMIELDRQARILLPDVLLVDDIADSGATLRPYRDHRLTAVWFRRWSCPLNIWSAEVERTEAWLVFPWENHAAAKADYDAYKTRASGVAAQ